MNGLNSENVNFEIIVQYYVMFSSLFPQVCLLCESIRSFQGRLGSESILGTYCADSLFEDNGSLSGDLLQPWIQVKCPINPYLECTESCTGSVYMQDHNIPGALFL